ncbi:hypothetical protein NW767_015475 [Fusarium falciforme]|nr:hypothetical protein NW767_015475 [Fusarium falciforme]
MKDLGSPRLTVEVYQRAEDYLNEGYPKNERGGSQGECFIVQHLQPIHWRDMDDYEDRNTSGVREHTNPDIDDINNDVEHTISGIGDVSGAGEDTDPDVSDTNDAGETLPAGLGSARRGSRVRKRKAASLAVDLTRRTEFPEQRRTSRLEKQLTRLRALRITLDLQSEASLGGETVNLLFQFCFGLFPTQNRHLFGPLWLQVDDPLLSMKPKFSPKKMKFTRSLCIAATLDIGRSSS